MSFQPVFAAASLAPGEARAATLTDQAGAEIALAIIRAEDGEVHAISQLCTHGDVPLDEGDISGCMVECWAHGAQFDLRTGEPTLPATSPVTVYPVEINNGQIMVDVD